jgi:beta-lactamase regulating signal transducer with metallopeptidase domain
MIAWIVESLIAITLLMLLVLAVRQPVARLFGAEWAYALWLLPLLRVILPPLPFAGGEMLSLIPPEAALIPAAGESAASLLSSDGSGQWMPLLALWAGGAAAFILWQAISYRRFLALLGTGRGRPRQARLPAFRSLKAKRWKGRSRSASSSGASSCRRCSSIATRRASRSWLSSMS